ncbi:MAG: hypothetical protein R8K20_08860, partial [Gallionellaceae bacterium]
CALPILVFLLASDFALAAQANIKSDPVELSFAFVGCNRVGWSAVKDPSFISPSTISTANTAQLLQTFTDVGNLKPAPKYLFLAGDIVLGEGTGLKKLSQEVSDWKALVKKNKSKLRKTKLIVFTGNHEVLQSIETPPGSGNYVETPNPPAYPYWQTSMSKFIHGKNGPRKGGADKLLDDEKKLSYTFRVGGNYFMVLNTDTEIDLNTAGNIPLQWISKKLRWAQKSPKVKNIFVIGHKPIATLGGESNIQPEQAGQLYALLNLPAKKGGASKVRAYLAAHLHSWAYNQNLSALPGMPAGTIPQIVAGNGGSPPDPSWKTEYFGFTVISIKRSGTVVAQSYGRSIPTSYYAQTPAPIPAVVQGKTYTLFTPQISASKPLIKH